MQENREQKIILVVDDEPDIRGLLKDVLESSGLVVKLVDDGVQALEYMEQEVPDLIITDLLLPGEHGIDLIKVVKEKYFIPVIVMSGIYSSKDVSHIMDEDIVESFFEKPVHLNELLEKIKSILKID